MVLETTGPLWLLLTADPSTSGSSPSGAPQRPPAKTRPWLTQPPAGLDSRPANGSRAGGVGGGLDRAMAFGGILVSSFLILPDRSWTSLHDVQSAEYL